MSILIKGMELPNPGQIILVEIDENGDVFAAYDGGRTKLAEYKAFPVPPHGDLIDREKLYEQTANWEAQALDQTLRYRPEEDRDEWRWWSAVLKERSTFKFDVADAPTIIPASEEGE